jgi:hypothetical protein
MSSTYHPTFSIPLLAARYTALANCTFNPLPGEAVTYVPITGMKVGFPATTHWGAQASVGPQTASIESANLANRFDDAMPVADPLPSWDFPLSTDQSDIQD